MLEKETGKVFCPNCNKTNIGVRRLSIDPPSQLHIEADCKSCGNLFAIDFSTPKGDLKPIIKILQNLQKESEEE